MRTYGTASKVLFLLYISRSRYWLYSGIDFCIWNYAQIMPLHLLLYWSTTHDVYFNFTKVTLIDSFCYSIKINSPFLLHYRILIYQCFCSVETDRIFCINMQTEMAYPCSISNIISIFSGLFPALRVISLNFSRNPRFGWYKCTT